MREWLAAAGIFVKCLKEMVLKSSVSHVRQASSEVDARCPRWGEVVNEVEVRDEGAKLHLIANPGLAKLSGEIRSLHHHLGVLRQVATIFGTTADEHPISSDTRTGLASLGFGKRTVNYSKCLCGQRRLNKS